MSARKGLLALAMVGFIVVGVMSLLGYDVFLPGTMLGEPQASETGRLAVIRAAAFLTMAFFIFRHLRNERPLSSVAPVQVFVNFLILIGLFRLPFDLAHWQDWLIMGGLVVASTLLYFENRSEAQKIFENEW
jgi:drug/metabolite transporter (DMT)-like permease